MSLLLSTLVLFFDFGDIFIPGTNQYLAMKETTGAFDGVRTDDWQKTDDWKRTDDWQRTDDGKRTDDWQTAKDRLHTSVCPYNYEGEKISMRKNIGWKTFCTT